jgi:hypothetical protein
VTYVTLASRAGVATRNVSARTERFAILTARRPLA